MIKHLLQNFKNYKQTFFKFNAWDDRNQPSQLENLLSQCDFCILPTDPNDPKKSAASHNRLVDAIRSGCITIASPIASYKELSKIAIINEDISIGLKYAMKHYKRLSTKYSHTRGSILEHFSQSNNHQKWKRCLSDVLNLNR